MLKAKSVLASLISAAVLATPYVSLAQSTAGSTTTTKKKSTSKKGASSVESQLDELKRQLDQQNQQIQTLQQQLQQRDANIQQMQQGVSQAQSAASAAQQAAQQAAAENQQKLQSVQSDMADLKTIQSNSVTTLQETQKRIVDLENPTALHYKGITLTPGGFIAAETLWRQNNESADIISSFNGIPYDHSPNSQLSEFRMTGRQSRLSLLAEGKLANVKMSGYYEMDFLGAAPTANENQSSSFNPRQRQLWAQAAFNNGWTITGGQTWSLWSSNKKGIETRQEWIPATIDGEYVVGYSFARLATFRITKNFHNKAWWAISLENPEMLNPSSLTTPPNVYGFGNGPTGADGSALSSTNTTSTDFMPDIITKLAFEPGWGHYEVKALMRVMRDKVPGNPAATPATSDYDDKAFAGGFGINGIMPLVKTKVDLILQANYGRGIGRYADSTNVETTYYQDGAINPLRQAQVLAGLETHPTTKLDWYFYGGDEYVGRSWFLGSDGKAYGYGSQMADNTGCELTYVGTAKCQANFRNLQEFTTGFWYRFYKGPAGTMQMGAQYEWIHKNTWHGDATTAPQPAAPEGTNNMFMTSFRYVLP
ncbi:hypothetical protein Acid345_3626 [Candidatus Koribacter versatilis Ellin345]|uniref:Uncharacterized protein n=1 Tax=Koribacter versatilis (strain Ellin345) TaxID=204669 RepID=Q1IKH3_KORVE|nr:hypothetical protein [Candidatus Koribacter versatilis]ABF42627.1 hypothetical protein Acid345_3626 [Candidatus Koribacter versatilis Ellin345]